VVLDEIFRENQSDKPRDLGQSLHVLNKKKMHKKQVKISKNKVIKLKNKTPLQT